MHIVDYNLDIDNERSEPEVQQSAQEQREVNPDAEYVEMEMPRNGTLCKRMIPQEVSCRFIKHKILRLWPCG